VQCQEYNRKVVEKRKLSRDQKHDWQRWLQQSLSLLGLQYELNEQRDNL
jgi:hypothetical protein